MSSSNGHPQQAPEAPQDFVFPPKRELQPHDVEVMVDSTGIAVRIRHQAPLALEPTEVVVPYGALLSAVLQVEGQRAGPLVRLFQQARHQHQQARVAADTAVRRILLG
jgi:hypothetical protein